MSTGWLSKYLINLPQITDSDIKQIVSDILKRLNSLSEKMRKLDMFIADFSDKYKLTGRGT